MFDTKRILAGAELKFSKVLVEVGRYLVFSLKRDSLLVAGLLTE